MLLQQLPGHATACGRDQGLFRSMQLSMVLDPGPQCMGSLEAVHAPSRALMHPAKLQKG